jgi:ParB-like chromosome segregation protein Spo0J
MTPVKKKGSVFSVIEWPLKRIKPYAGNPRKRSKHAVEKVASSIREFGWRQPIVVDEAGVILVGHTRRDAAESLGMKSAPVHIAVGLSEQQKRAYRIADNRTNEETEWDEELLSLELKGLDDPELSGFDSEELKKFIQSLELIAPDAFREFDETLETEHQCPKCGYRWSGSSAGQ